jgi:hypothetical protein
VPCQHAKKNINNAQSDPSRASPPSLALIPSFYDTLIAIATDITDHFSSTVAPKTVTSRSPHIWHSGSIASHTTAMASSNPWLQRQRKSDLVEIAQRLGLEE